MVHADAIGIAAAGDATEVLIGEIVGKGQVRTELLKPGLALGAGAVRVHHTTDGGEIAGFKLFDGGANFGDAADDFVAGNTRIDGGHEAAPLVADLVEVGMADAAEKDFDLDVGFTGIAAVDFCGGQRRSCAGGGVSF